MLRSPFEEVPQKFELEHWKWSLLIIYPIETFQTNDLDVTGGLSVERHLTRMVSTSFVSPTKNSLGLVSEIRERGFFRILGY